MALSHIGIIHGDIVWLELKIKPEPLGNRVRCLSREGGKVWIR